MKKVLRCIKHPKKRQYILDHDDGFGYSRIYLNSEDEVDIDLDTIYYTDEEDSYDRDPSYKSYYTDEEDYDYCDPFESGN